MHAIGACPSGVVVHDKPWGRDHVRTKRRGGTTNSWSGKPAASSTTHIKSTPDAQFRTRKAFPKCDNRPVVAAHYSVASRANQVPSPPPQLNSSTGNQLSSIENAPTTTKFGDSALPNFEDAKRCSPVQHAEPGNETVGALTKDIANITTSSAAPTFTRATGLLPLNPGLNTRSHEHHQRKRTATSIVPWLEQLFCAITSDNVPGVVSLLSRYRIVHHKENDVNGGDSTVTTGTYSRTSRSGSTTKKQTTISGVSQKERFDVNSLIFGMFVEPLHRNSQPSNSSSSKLHEYRTNSSSMVQTLSKTSNNQISSSKERPQFRFIGYGAPTLAIPDKQWLNTASMLHVAVWMNAVNVAEYLVKLGASSSICDGLGVSVYIRATSATIRSILRKPPMPTSVKVLSTRNGGCVLQWNCIEAFPPVVEYHVRDLEQGLSWMFRVDEVQVHSLSRSGRKTILCQLPSGHIWSSHAYQFKIRARNSEGFWGDSSDPTEVVVIPHWVSDWADQDATEFDRRRESENLNGNHDTDNETLNNVHARYVPLKLGSMSFGDVSPKRYFERVLALQHQAAVRIQALFRGVSSRSITMTIRFAREQGMHRNRAASKIQCVVRGVLVRSAAHRWREARERYLRGELKGRRGRAQGRRRQQKQVRLKGNNAGKGKRTLRMEELYGSETLLRLQSDWGSEKDSQSEEALEPVNLGFVLEFPPSWRA